MSGWILRGRFKNGVITSRIWGLVAGDLDSSGLCCVRPHSDLGCAAHPVSEVDFDDLCGGDLGNPCPNHLLKMPGKIKFVFPLQVLQL